MMNFCTLYDSNYISKGIALYLSIAKYTDDFTMYVMAMDRKCDEMLKEINFPHIVVECLDDNTTPELIEAKGNRSRAEFCWTCGSFVTLCFLTKYNLPDITYLDSDLMFFCSPQVIFDELATKNASVGLSPHFIPYNATGKYCVQYCYFKNDKDGLAALTWWKDECLKWCYSQIEDGKYGDQMYLNHMPRLFDNVCDIENRGTGIAYWNEFNYKFTKDAVLYKGCKYPYVFCHYSGFNISWRDRKVVVKECYPVKSSLRTFLVNPYVDLLKNVYCNYWNQQAKSVEYIKDYGISTLVINKVTNFFKHFGPFNKFKAYLLIKKYSKRHSPYSEKKK